MTAALNDETRYVIIEVLIFTMWYQALEQDYILGKSRSEIMEGTKKHEDPG